MRALSIRQPYAELILRGIKPIEFRSRPTRIIGQQWADQRSEVRKADSLTSDFRPQTSLSEWHLTDVERAKRFRKPKGHPQAVWFTPF